MVMFSLYLTNEVPFKNIYLHGLVRDAKGQKMSKSKGNVISPLEISNEYGTDALRMGLIVNNAPGIDMNLDPKKIEAYKKFANKIWNATRFVLEKTFDFNDEADINSLNENHKEIYKDWREKLKEITGDIKNYRMHLASEKIYAYFWKEFCDKILEEVKLEIINNTKNKTSAQNLIKNLLREQIITLHPFMPFITEEIWKNIKNKDDELLMITKWPI